MSFTNDASGQFDIASKADKAPISERWKRLDSYEKQIALLTAAGYNNEAAAKAVSTNPHSVRVTKVSIFKKLEVSSDAGLTREVTAAPLRPAKDYPLLSIHKPQRLSALSGQEMEIVECVVARYSREDIAAELGITEDIVDEFVRGIPANIGLPSMQEVVGLFILARAQKLPVADTGLKRELAASL